MTTGMYIAILLYRILLIGALMYTVGYLNWSGWWLCFLITIPLVESNK